MAAKSTSKPKTETKPKVSPKPKAETKDEAKEEAKEKYKSNGIYEPSSFIAKLFGFADDVRRIQQLTKDGILPTVEVVEGGHKVRRYDLIPTVQRYVKYLRDKAYGRERSNTEQELKEQKLKAEVALKESQGELHRLRTEIAAGKYISLETVKDDYVRFFGVFKKFALGLPARIIGQISAYIDPEVARLLEKSLDDETKRLLSSFVISGVLPEEMGRRGKKSKPIQEIPGGSIPEGGAGVPEAAGGDNRIGVG
ncbi:MAG: hypothetical protein LUE27_05470 [Clostridia bacterium]|nr:hypothetical protein [Clostridia bacterium]